MRVYARMPEVDEWHAGQRLEGVVGGELAGANALDQLPQALAVHPDPLTAGQYPSRKGRAPLGGA
jgi:hypothetical protein